MSARGPVPAPESAPVPPAGAASRGVLFGRPVATADVLGLLMVIVFVAAVLRLDQLAQNPPEFFEDELSGAVSAWSIATTGHDVERTVLPFMVTRLELKQPLYFFATVPFQALLGSTPFAARLPAVLFGLASVLLVVWLVRVLRGSYLEALIAGALFAITPWAVHYSRAGWEPAAFLPFTLGGLGLLWVGLRDHRRLAIVAAATVLAVGAYSYHPALLMNVAVAVLVGLLHARDLRRADVGSLAIGAAVGALILVPYVLAWRDPLYFFRAQTISVFNHGLTIDALEAAWDNYWAQWDPGFLFGGRAPNPRINPGQLLYPWTLPFAVAGLDLIAHRRTRADWLLVALLVIGPLPAAITNDGTTPHAARGLVALPAIVMVTSLGIARSLGWLARLRAGRFLEPIGAAVLVAAASWQGSVWLHSYLVDYPLQSANWWGYGTAAAFRLVDSRVPPGGVVCIATNDISGFTFPHQVAYYLPHRTFTVIESLGDERCSTAGTYVLAFADRQLDVPVRPLGVVNDIHGDPEFQLSLVENGPG